MLQEDMFTKRTLILINSNTAYVLEMNNYPFVSIGLLDWRFEFLWTMIREDNVSSML